MRRNSPWTGWPSIFSAIFCERSPSATASMHARDLGGRTHEVVDHRVDGVDGLGPGSRRRSSTSRRSVIRPSRPMTLLTRPSSSVRPSRRSAKLVERLCHVAHDAALLSRKPHAHFAVPRGTEGVEQLLQVLLLDLDRAVVAARPACRGGRRARWQPSSSDGFGSRRAATVGSFVARDGCAAGGRIPRWATRLPAMPRHIRPREAESGQSIGQPA